MFFKLFVASVTGSRVASRIFSPWIVMLLAVEVNAAQTVSLTKKQRIRSKRAGGESLLDDLRNQWSVSLSSARWSC